MGERCSCKTQRQAAGPLTHAPPTHLAHVCKHGVRHIGHGCAHAIGAVHVEAVKHGPPACEAGVDAALCGVEQGGNRGPQRSALALFCSKLGAVVPGRQACVVGGAFGVGAHQGGGAVLGQTVHRDHLLSVGESSVGCGISAQGWEDGIQKGASRGDGTVQRRAAHVGVVCVEGAAVGGAHHAVPRPLWPHGRIQAGGAARRAGRRVEIASAVGEAGVVRLALALGQQRGAVGGVRLLHRVPGEWGMRVSPGAASQRRQDGKHVAQGRPCARLQQRRLGQHIAGAVPLHAVHHQHLSVGAARGQGQQERQEQSLQQTGGRRRA